MIRTLIVCAAALVAPVSAAAVQMSLPGGARQLSERISPMEAYALPTGAFADGTVPERIFEGRVQKQTWRINGGATTPLQLIAPLRDQLAAEGFTLLLDCDDRACGGFDFRFKTEVVPAPDMHVDIHNYRFVSATRGDDEAVSILVSRARSAAYVQVVHVSAPGDDQLGVDSGGDDLPDSGQATTLSLAALLEADGHVVLADLEFKSGADALEVRPYASLADLAEYLAAHADRRIVLVGHTDSSGTLVANISLSKRRAQAVRDRMISAYDLPPDQLDAEGMGYLAPVASNLTNDGREINRRVEAVLLSAN